MTIKGFFCVLGIVISQFAFGQQAKFAKDLHDFGKVKEGDGPVTYTFSFINEGEQPLQIAGVKASCGCTTPAWTSEQIQPNDTGTVTAQYNPLNRPGHFKKSLTVNYLGGGTSTLYIQGNVMPKPKSLEEELPVQMGNLRVKYKTFSMGKITTEKPVEQSFEVYNPGDSVWDWIPEKAFLPQHISVRYDPIYLKPKEHGVITLTFDPEKSENLGFISDNIKLFTSETSQPEKEFNVMTTVQEYFPPMTKAELDNAPHLGVSSRRYNLGSVQQGEVAATSVEIANTGKRPLLIRQVKTNCGCVVTSLEKDKIAPGESATLEVRFDTTDRRGNQYKTITVFSNDPSGPTQNITIQARVND